MVEDLLISGVVDSAHLQRGRRRQQAVPASPSLIGGIGHPASQPPARNLALLLTDRSARLVACGGDEYCGARGTKALNDLQHNKPFILQNENRMPKQDGVLHR